MGEPLMFGKRNIMIYKCCKEAFERLCKEDEIKIKVKYKDIYITSKYAYLMYEYNCRNTKQIMRNVIECYEEKIDELKEKNVSG